MTTLSTSRPSAQRALVIGIVVVVLVGLASAAVFSRIDGSTIGVVLPTAVTAAGMSWYSFYRLLHGASSSSLDQLATFIQNPAGEQASAEGWKDTGDARIDAIAARVVALRSEVAAHQRGLDYVATHDPLTGLGNRRHLGERLAQALNHIRSHPNLPISLMLIGVDGFKLINDGLGHAAGDAALCEVAKRLRGLLRPEDAVARLDGDEFALVLFDLRAREAKSVFDKLKKSIAMPLNLDGRTVNLSASAGVAEGIAGMTVHDWQRQADLALVDGKRSDRESFSVFRQSLQSDAARQLRLEHALRLAIANDDIEVWFQPLVDGRNGHVLGLEALSRWTHEGEAIAPQEFVSLAESAGLISKLGYSVLTHTCRTLSGLRKGHPSLRCAVNLSVGQFLNGDIEAELSAILQASELPISALRFEITESLVATHESGIVPTMRRLVELGAEFSLDDFGTGFSSLDRLRQLPIKTLKIDRSFVTPLQLGDEVIVRNICSLSRDLGLDTIAEGVEHEEERRRLCAIGCNAMQGYLLARPMPATELVKWLEHRVLRC